MHRTRSQLIQAECPGHRRCPGSASSQLRGNKGMNHSVVDTYTWEERVEAIG